MTDEQRSDNMRRIRSTGTGPELRVARVLDSLGVLYDSQAGWLAGTPDFLLPELNAVLFVNGCFWHQHGARKCAKRIPKTNSSYWRTKLMRNVSRDRRVARSLRASGFHVLTIWECETRDPTLLERRIRSRLRRLGVKSSVDCDLSQCNVPS
jgi:DNA mismatch endonuclease, patch repair protein